MERSAGTLRWPIGLSLSALLIAVSLPAHAAAPAHFWSKRFGTVNDDVAYAVAVDNAGNVFVTGNGALSDFGGVLLGTVGNQYLVKYSPRGVFLWGQRFGGLGQFNNNAFGVAVDPNGNVAITGEFSGTTTIGGTALTSNGTQGDIYIAEFNRGGTLIWARGIGSQGIDTGFDVAMDASGNVYCTGIFQAQVNFGFVFLTSAGLYDIYLVKYNSTGTNLLGSRYGGSLDEWPTALVSDASGNLILTGYFGASAAITFGGQFFVGAGGTDMFVAYFNSALTHQWSRRVGGTNNDHGDAVAFDGSGNVFLLGSFSSIADFGNGPLTSAGGFDIGLGKYSAAGTPLWSKRFGGTGTDLADGVAASATGNVFLTGGFNGSVDFGGGALAGTSGGSDIVFASYDAAGNHRWSTFAGTNSHDDRGTSIAVDPAGSVVGTGFFWGLADFGGGPLVGTGNEIFLARYGINTYSPAISSVADIGNDQGRKVRIRFQRSGDDDLVSLTPVVQYEAFRRDDPTPSSSVVSPVAMAPHELLVNGWTQAGTVAAHGDATYGIDVPTDADSTIALGQHYSAFFIRAATATPGVYYDSPPDSGYSKDNLAPGVPQNLAYTAGDLTWHESTAADFDYFTVYGSNSNSFGAATVVDYSVAPAMNVVASPYVYYYVTATDFSGNEGKPAKINALTGVGGTPTSYVLSVSNYPNPFNPRTTVSYTVPSRGYVKVAVYDAHGAHVATLFDGERNAGAYSVDWDGRADDAAVAASGVYFARIEQNGATRTKKMVLLK